MSNTLPCKKCPSDMTLEVVNGEKRWVCADCGFSMAYSEKKTLPPIKPWMFGVALILGAVIYSLVQ